ncbi:hypothetical protein CFOL_v3_00465 [Cephalotus follicularis]|uniref:Uncharacterized protein n=1 Tax=Cephalotus follicularis TaxID=3775 RepID=A0A1Q3AMD9_CEPFO|nr:hypothetical protein CFOL_v3_00465 [Cephalotus follicularis]
MKKFIEDLGVVLGIDDPVSLYCDNNGAMTQAKKPRSHSKSKHILRHFHLIREIVDRGDIKVERVPGQDNIADPLTKALPKAVFDRHLNAMGERHYGNWL